MCKQLFVYNKSFSYTFAKLKNIRIMKYLLPLFLSLILGFTSCKKEEPLTEPAFELISERISGSNDFSFQFYLHGSGFIWINDLIQKPNGEFLLLGRFISKIRGANNQKFIASLHSNGELAWFRILNINENVSFENIIIRLYDDKINLFAISESNLPPVGYTRKATLIQLDSEGEVILEKIYGVGGVLTNNGAINLTNDKIVIPTANTQSANAFVYAIVDINSGQIEVQKTVQGNLLSTTYLSDNNILFTYIKHQDNPVPLVELLKVNSNGDTLWSIENSAIDNGYLRSVTATDDGSFVASFSSSVSPESIHITKYDNNGNVIWNYTNTKASPQVAASLGGRDYFYAGSSAQGVEVNRLDIETGESLWNKTIANTVGSTVFKIYPTHDGGLLILFASTSNNKYFLQKLDSNGN